MSKQERVVCAAIRFIRVNERTGNESNIDVLCIRYGDESVKKFREELERSLYHYTEKEIKGFKTNKNRFVDPKEAMQIAIDAKQIIYLNSLYEQYTQDVIGNRGVSDRGRDLFNMWTHQLNIFKYQDLKPEDLY